MSVKFRNFSAIPQVNIFASHHKVEFAAKLEKDSNLAVSIVDPEDNRTHKKVFAGTVYPSNDGNAKGIISNDYDVTYGDANIAVCTHGVIKSCVLPAVVTDAAKAVLKGIEFQSPLVTLSAALTCPKKDKVEIGTTEITAILVLSNATFLPIAEAVSKYTLSGVDGAKVQKVTIKTSKLIAVNINIASVAKSGTLSITIDPSVTTAKSKMDAVEIADIGLNK